MSDEPTTCEPLLPPPTIDHGPELGERQHFRFPAPPVCDPPRRCINWEHQFCPTCSPGGNR